MTQKVLAARIDVDPMTVSRWERGVAQPRDDEAERLRRETGVVVYESEATLTDRVGVLEYVVSELLVALREGEAGVTQRSGEAIANATEAMAAAAPVQPPSPRRARRPARKDQ